MFTVWAIRIGTCMACSRQDVECLEVESPPLMRRGLLCVQDFRRQVKLAAAVSSETVAREPDQATDVVRTRDDNGRH